MSQNVQQMSLFSDAAIKAMTAYNSDSATLNAPLTPEQKEGRHKVKDFGEVIFGAAKMIRVYSKQDLSNMSDVQLLKIKKQNIYDVDDLIDESTDPLSAALIKALYRRIRNPKVDRTGVKVTIRQDVEGFVEYMCAMYRILKNLTYQELLSNILILSAQEMAIIDRLKQKIFINHEYSWVGVNFFSSFLHFGVGYQTLWSYLLSGDAATLNKRIEDLIGASCFRKAYTSKKDLEMDLRFDRFHFGIIQDVDQLVADCKALPSAKTYYLCYYGTDVYGAAKLCTSNDDVNAYHQSVIERWIDNATKMQDRLSSQVVPVRKAAWKPITLKVVSRIGPIYRDNQRNVDGHDFMNTFNVRGGQYGSSMNDEERQNALNHAYDAFMDLADVLQVDPKAIALNGTLGIAFGARGHGNALAHYEPLHHVINLTKMKGAGSLAHEWFHALDHFLNASLSPMSLSLLSDLTSEYTEGSAMGHLLEVIKMDKFGNSTEYMKRSRLTAETTIGYWTQNCELCARAFNCYVSDTLKAMGRQSDYLCGMAFEPNSPTLLFSSDEEKNRIYDAFDELLNEWKEELNRQ